MKQVFHTAEGCVKQQDVKLSKTKHNEGREWFNRYGEGLAALTSGIFIAIAWAIGSGGSHLWSIIFYLIAFAVGGFVKAKEGLHTLIAEHDLDVNLLMLIAAIGAASIGYWTEGAVLIFIFSFSGALETYTMDRSSRDISSLMDLKPETAVLFKDGLETVVAIEALTVGDIVLVKPGERIPSDGVVLEGASAVNQSSITGESVPVDKGEGDEVFAGTLNGQGALFIEVSQLSESTLFSKIIRLVQEAQSEKPASQLFMERFERIYAKSIILICLLLIVVPPLLFHLAWEQTFYKAMVFLVVASPCALVASIMPAMLSAISNSARKGLLFKGGAHLENLATIKAIAFDKTGTLTSGKPVVTDILSFQEMSISEMLRIAASMESLSEHPLAKAIVLESQVQGVVLDRPSDFRMLTGWGVQAQWKGDLWKIGKPAFLDNRFRTEELKEVIDRLEREGKTVTVMHNSQGVVGVIALRDKIRAEAKHAVALLRALGVQVAMLTGDQKQTAHAIAKELGIELVYADLLPEDKVTRIKELKQTFGSIAMVGDGVNDAPALATATVGIAMGVAGSDAALETADLVLMNDDTAIIADAIVLGKRTKVVIKQNIIFAMTVIITLIAANFVQGIALPLGVVGHEGSTILVILNGLRLLRQR
ncbi:cadmium-translocating P-type ATPase [Paenibacillus ferrarius]|uniref:Cadmium-translocating P-type ATPase n=1 Tax=Paenibacillus ferrarius TaxID=1469647 RepID=A0A1V4H672_9BACL|nr:heavy metal translocating P-type ATPase [Paenibacillus ferrarius]OPH46716.1 cadmium-translocating P-type ATPase [Paenibacillus ferrarius]